MALCIIGAGETARIAATLFSLSWMHSVEKVPWEEQWRVEQDKLVVVQARVKGSGAGMEPPPHARLEGGWYVWTPTDGERREIVLRQTEFGAWTFCATGAPCAPLTSLLPRAADPITLRPCA